MKWSNVNLSNRRLLFAVLIVSLALGSSVKGQPKSVAHLDPAENLVMRALKAEAEGKVDERGRLLQEAVTVSPAYAPARWHLGQIKVGNQWLSPEEIAKQGLDNVALSRYVEMRQSNSSLPKWIWRSELDWNGVHFFRKTFELPARPVRAELKLWMPAFQIFLNPTADCVLFVNGKKIHSGKFTRDPEEFHVEKELREGVNTLALQVNNPIGPGMLLWLDGHQKDGSIFSVASNNLWTVATDEQKGWHLPEFDDGDWKTVVTIDPSNPRNSGVTKRPVLPSTNFPHFEESWARWCDNLKLEPQSRYHWSRVLLAQPNYSAAIKALGLKRVGNELLTQQQIEERRTAETALKKAIARWSPSLEAARHQLKSKSDKVVEAARKRIEETVERDAVPIFRSMLTDEKHPVETAFVTASIVALGRIDDSSAIDVILDAVYHHPDPSVITEAAKVLADRDLTTFVPMLMSRFDSEVSFTSQTKTERIKTITRGNKDEEEVRVGNRVLKKGETVHILSYNIEVTFVKPGPEGDVRETKVEKFSQHREPEVRLAAISAEIEKQNANTRRHNRVLSNLLSIVSGEDLGEQPQPWWEWWKKYNELEYTSVPSVRWVSWWDQFQDSEKFVQSTTRPRECFVAGTPVWTRRGMVPIETILAGDEVLSQDPQTGSLAYKLVLKVPTCYPLSLVRVTIGRDSIVCTSVHRFWVSGKGWRMAKQIVEGAILHSLNGPLEVTSVSTVENQVTFNLITEDYHTFFVGREKILVHDAGAPEMTDCIVPGLRRSAVGQ